MPGGPSDFGKWDLFVGLGVAEVGSATDASLNASGASSGDGLDFANTTKPSA
jgi:hypothetical protein